VARNLLQGRGRNLIAAPPQTIQAQREAALGVAPLADPVNIAPPQGQIPQTIAGLPELQSSGLLSDQSGARTLAVAPALLTATDPNEIAQIVTSNFPDISQTFERDEAGNTYPVLVNRNTGAATLINRPGISGLDVVQGLGLAAAFTPAARAATVPSAALAGAGTQAGIEGVQALSGGEVNPEDVALAGAGAAGAQKIGSMVGEFFKKQSPTKQKIAELVEQNSDDIQRAGFTVQPGTTTVVKDRAAQELKRQGVDDGTVALIQTASKADKDSMRKALKILQAAKRSKTTAVSNRPGDAAGDVLKARYDAVRDINKKAAKSIEREARKLEGLEANLGGAYDMFLDELQDLGVSITRTEKGKLKGIYGNSEFARSRTTQKLLDDFINRSDSASMDALDAHRLKRVIDGSVEFGRKNIEPIQSKAEAALKNLRRGINSELQGLSPAYKKANNTFSDTKGALDDFKGIAGAKFNPDSPNAGKQLTGVARTLMSNNQSRVPAMDAINGLQETAKRHGVNFEDDILKQAAFMDELETMFGSAAPTSFGGQIEKFGRRAVEGDMKEVAIEGIKTGVKKARGINEDALMKALEEILK